MESPGKAWAHVREFSFLKGVQAAHSQMLSKVLLCGEPQEGNPFNIECIYQFTLDGDSTTPKFKALGDFLDSRAYAAMG